jgi:hypothetical protein
MDAMLKRTPAKVIALKVDFFIMVIVVIVFSEE